MRPQRYPGSLSPFFYYGRSYDGHLVKYFIFGMKHISFIISIIQQNLQWSSQAKALFKGLLDDIDKADAWSLKTTPGESDLMTSYTGKSR